MKVLFIGFEPFTPLQIVIKGLKKIRFVSHYVRNSNRYFVKLDDASVLLRGFLGHSEQGNVNIVKSFCQKLNINLCKASRAQSNRPLRSSSGGGINTFLI